MLDSTDLLMQILETPISRKVEATIRERVEANLCVCCGNYPIHRNGQCRRCDYETERITREMTKAKRAAFLAELYRDGLRLRPYDVRNFRKPMSILRKRAQ